MLTARLAGLLAVLSVVASSASASSSSCAEELLSGGGQVAVELQALATRLSAAPPTSAAGLTAALQRGKLLLSAGCAAEAAVQIEAVARVAPQQGNTWWQAGVAHLQAAKQTTAALAGGGAQRRQKPGAVAAHFGSALSALQLSADSATAPDVALRALSLMGKTLYEEKQYAAAAAAWHRADEHKLLGGGKRGLDGSVAELTLWGIALMNAKPVPDSEGAARAFARAAQTDPGNPDGWYNAGLASLSAAAVPPVPHGRRGAGSVGGGGGGGGSSAASGTHAARMAASAAHLEASRQFLERFLHALQQGHEALKKKQQQQQQHQHQHQHQQDQQQQSDQQHDRKLQEQLDAAQQNVAGALARIATTDIALGAAPAALSTVARLLPVSREQTVSTEAAKAETWALWRTARASALARSLARSNADAARAAKVLGAERRGMRALSGQLAKKKHVAATRGATATAAAARGWGELAGASAAMSYVAKRLRAPADGLVRAKAASSTRQQQQQQQQRHEAAAMDNADDSALHALFAPLAAATANSAKAGATPSAGFVAFLQNYYETSALVLRADGAVEAHPFAPLGEAADQTRTWAPSAGAKAQRGPFAEALLDWFSWHDMEPYLRALQLRHGGAALGALRSTTAAGAAEESGAGLLDVEPASHDSDASADARPLDMHQVYRLLSGLRLGPSGAATRSPPTTLVLNGLERTHSGCRRLALALRRLFGHRVLVSAHATTALPARSGNSSVPGPSDESVASWAAPLIPTAPAVAAPPLPRWEEHGMFVSQVTGSRAWRLWPRQGREAWMGSAAAHKTAAKEVAVPLAGQRRQRVKSRGSEGADDGSWVAQGRAAREAGLPTAGSVSLVLHEGDVMYLPNGIPHVALPPAAGGPGSDGDAAGMSVHLSAALPIERQPKDDAGAAVRDDLAWRQATVPSELARDRYRHNEELGDVEDVMQLEAKRRARIGDLTLLRTREYALGVLRDLPCASMGLDATSAMLRRALPPPAALTTAMAGYTARHFLGSASMTESAEKCRAARKNADDSAARGADAFTHAFDGSGATWKDALVDALLDVSAAPPARVAAAGEDEDSVGLLLLALVGGPTGGGGEEEGALLQAARRVLARTQEAETSRDVLDAMMHGGGAVFHGDGAGSGIVDSGRFHLSALGRLASLGTAPKLRLRGRRTESGARFEATTLEGSGATRVSVGVVHLPEKSDGPLRLEMPAPDEQAVGQATAFWSALASTECLDIAARGNCAAAAGGGDDIDEDHAAAEPRVLDDRDVTVFGKLGTAVPLGAWRTLLALGVVEPCR